MENYLYLLELFVETVKFSSNFPECPKPYEVVISGEVGKFQKMDVFSIHTPGPSVDDDSHRNEITLNSGRSTLFSCSTEDLLQKIDQYPFEINLYVRQKLAATATVGWTREFYALIRKAPETYGIAGPVVMQDQFLLKENGTERIMGDIKASVRLSSFGNSIQTSFQLISTERDTNKKYLVRGARGETTFECEKVNEGTSGEIIPLTSIFTNEKNDGDNVSFMALFKSTMDPKLSITPEEFNVAISSLFNRKTVSNMTFDIISLMERPDEHKCIDLRIRGGSRGFIFEFDTPVIKTEDGSQPTSEELIEHESEQEIEPHLTAEYINQMLCKRKDCPAAKKFKEFGIGPLANIRGLGGLYDHPSIPVTYGLSQTYGVFDEYGPYGLFSRPKRPSNPFIPKKDSNWTSSCWSPKRKQQDKKEENRSKPPCPCKKYKHNACLCLGEEQPPLRLTGGGVLDYDDVQSPFHECKEILDQFDEILAKYKKALGPCGKVTCPFAPNVTKESCKKMCPGDMSKYSKDALSVPTAPTVEPSVAVSEKKKQIKPACGSPKCAYAKMKTGLIDEDAEMELQYLPSAPSGKCGHPKCPYPVEPELPPIHWECPDPLPKGRCTNPDCPYLPKEIKCLNAVLAKGPCGNFNCPFSPPPPCSSPFCPFTNKECPYQKPPADDESICSNPDCPYTPKNETCDNPECPFAEKKQEKDVTCQMPPCPYAMNSYVQSLLACMFALKGGSDRLQICFGGPGCPFNNNQAPSQNVCDSPFCPFQPKPEKPVCGATGKQAAPQICAKKPSPIKGPCGNPSCPHAKRGEADQSPRRKREEGKELEEGDIEYTVETRTSVDLEPCTPQSCKSKGGNLTCDACPCNEGPNPEGSFSRNIECCYDPKTCYKKPSPCYVLPPKDDICDNPECPFAPKPPCKPPPCASHPCSAGVPPCSTPFPTCPYAMDPLQALLAYCMPISVCPDAVCPFPDKNLLQICMRHGPCIAQQQTPKEEAVCENMTCPYTRKEGGDDITSQKGKRTLQETTSEGGIEYTTDERIEADNAPCSKKTCKAEGGDLVCTECPCGEQAGDDIEYRSDTRLSVDMAPCTKKTCQSKGGKLVCDVCPCSKTQSETKTGKKKKIGRDTQSAPILGEHKKKRKGRGKWVYSVGDKYPGVQIGHRECVMPSSNVPPKMGWLWNIHTPCLQLKPRRGWRPGAIGRTLAARIKRHRERQGLQMLALKDLRKGGGAGYGMYESGTSIHVQPKPTLQIKKQDGCYWITMNPLKDPHTLVENESPYMDCTPLQFKIVKNKDKQKLEGENEEYRSCFCGDAEEHIESSSSDSELEIEFTPPAGIIHPERFKKKRNVVHCDTQYLTTDFETKSEPDKASKKGKKEKGKKGKEKGKKKGKKGKKK